MKVDKKVWKSSIELRIHFQKGYWYKLCKKHLKDIDSKKFSWTEDLIRSADGCDVPWCGETLAHEVFPAKNCICSWFKMKKDAK